MSVVREKVKIKFRDVLKQNNLDQLDDDILDYLFQVFNDDISLSLEEKESIITTYVPDLKDNDVVNVLISLLHCSFYNQENELSTDCNILIEEAPPNQGCFNFVNEEIGRHDEVDIQKKTKNESDVAFLISMMSLNRELVEYVYHDICVCSRAASAEYLLENCSNDDGVKSVMGKMEDAKLSAKQFEEEEILREKNLKSSIFMRYGDQAVPPKYPDQKKKGGPAPVLIVTTVGGGDRKTRFRDGQIVSRKGEKVIYDKDPWDDYDSGSRGKVKTKGKRGKGFV